jgi:hypothetical protein
MFGDGKSILKRGITDIFTNITNITDIKFLSVKFYKLDL